MSAIHGYFPQIGNHNFKIVDGKNLFRSKNGKRTFKLDVFSMNGCELASISIYYE